MRILKILLLSTALAAFGAATAVAQPLQYAAKTGETKAKVKKTKKYAAKKTYKKKAVKAKKTKKVYAAKTKKRKTTPSTDSEAAPGNPPPGSSTN